MNITLPGGQAKSFLIQHRAYGSSAYTITIKTTASGEVICAPPWGPTVVISDGTNVRYMSLPPIGSFWDYAGSSVPNWVSGCTVPPYLNCDGSTFSATTYPALAVVLASTTLPDSRGRFRAALNQTTGRITSGSSTGGVDGNTNAASGGSQTTTLSAANVDLPAHTHALQGNWQNLSSAGATVTVPVAVTGFTFFGSTLTSTYALGYTNTYTSTFASPTNFSNIPPAYVGGITMVRAG